MIIIIFNININDNNNIYIITRITCKLQKNIPYSIKHKINIKTVTLNKQKAVKLILSFKS